MLFQFEDSHRLKLRSPEHLLQLLKEVKEGNVETKRGLLNIDEYKLGTNDRSRSTLLMVEILREFQLMFDFEPGQIRGLQPLIELLEYGIENTSGWIYEHKGWAELGSLRGPFGVIDVRKCANCESVYPAASSGGFAEIGLFNCSHCNCVKTGSLIATGKETLCTLGHEQVNGKCPRCGSKEMIRSRTISGYEYFLDRPLINELRFCCMQPASS
jgi:hypothetical protein